LQNTCKGWTLYKRAYGWLVSSQHEETLRRLLSVSAKVLSFSGKEQEIEARGTLKQVMRGYEARLVKQALQRAGGIVTQAARLLGVSHQTLIYLLNHRHRNLLPERTPVIRRRRHAAKE
jgi:DNA phosphorothioation-dependent restriction protein DptG